MSKTVTATQTISDPFGKFIVLSVAIHIAVGVAFLVKAVIFPAEPINIRSAIRVDVVGMPDKIETPKPKPKAAEPEKVKIPEKAPPKPEPKPTPKPKPVVKKAPAKPKVNLKKTKSEQDQAMERLKALEAIEKLKEETKEEEVVAQEYKGNVISSGSSLTGLDRIAFEKYFDEMQSHVKQQWNLPTWLASANLKGVVAVKIDERGYVIDRVITQSSGNDVFDNLVLETVDRASPFPAPPNRLKNVLKLNGFQLGFPD